MLQKLLATHGPAAVLAYLSRYTHRVQAWVPPVPAGYKGKIAMVLTEVCH